MKALKNITGIMALALLWATTAAHASATRNLEADTVSSPDHSKVQTMPSATGTLLNYSSAPTNHGVVIGTGGSAVGSTAAGTAGQVLTSNGPSSDPTFQNVASTSVGAWYNGTPTTTITSNVSTVANYPTKQFDVGGTGSDYNTTTGEYTVASGNAGYYSVVCAGEISATNLNYAIASIFKNGSVVQVNFMQYGSAMSIDLGVSVSLNMLHLNVGDKVRCQFDTNGSSPTWGTGIGGTDQISIVRTGI